MQNKTIKIENVDLFYREAGDPKNPTIVLLHGYPASSHMFRDLIPLLAETHHVLAPDYPGFGFTKSPAPAEFPYTFAKLAEVVSQWLSKLGVDRYFLYMQDYGAPVGLRIASQSPDRILGLIVQNGNAYEEGLTDAWAGIRAYWNEKSSENGEALLELCSPDFVRLMYTDGVKDAEAIAPESWALDTHFLSDPERREIQVALFYDYQSNVALYDAWQNYLREHKPPILVVWGLNDMFFARPGAEAFGRDVPEAVFRFYQTGHFALEECAAEIGDEIRQFVQKLDVGHKCLQKA